MCARSAHEVSRLVANVSPVWYNRGMMKNTETNPSTDLYATLARINAAIAAQNAEREQWVSDYDNNNSNKE